MCVHDHLAPAWISPENAMTTRPHPHIDPATVTDPFEGEIMHRRDCLGSLTAGREIGPD